MRKILTPAAGAAAAFFMLSPATAAAQQLPPGAELHGQQVQVLAANGETNTLTFQPDGSLYISSTNGQSAQGNWSVQGNQMCVSVGAARECFPYRAAFRAQQPVSMVSDCGASSQWTALGVNEPPVQRRAGERG
jgi:hypothetical protein